jgi:hypothetical protein
MALTIIEYKGVNVSLMQNYNLYFDAMGKLITQIN